MAQAKGVLEAALRGDTAKASPVYGDALDVGAAESSQVNGEYASRGVSKVDRERCDTEGLAMGRWGDGAFMSLID